MKRLFGCVLTAFILAGLSGCVLGESGFRPLFDGSDLEGWHAEGGNIECWTVRDGVLSCIAPGGGELTTDSLYGDFVLRVDWRIFAGGNSGIGLRFPSSSHVSEAGMEIQILDDGAAIHRNIKPAQHTGSIYLQVPARQGATRPLGQWNSYKITCNGPLVIVELNGKEIVRQNLDQCTEGKEGLTPLAKRPRSGHIGLQSHDTRVDFRNIRLKKL